MDQADRLVQTALDRLDAEVRSQPALQRGLDPSTGSIVRLVSPSADLSLEALPSRTSSSRDWSHLVEQVRHAALRVREVEAQAREQELRVQELLEKVREDVAEATARVAAAEARAHEAQSRAEALVKAAEQRAQASEERARLAEQWLAQVQDAITSGFPDDPS